MFGIIRIGDLTTSGGVVLSGSTTMKFNNIGVVRQGDPVLCPIPLHGLNVIAMGHPAIKDNGLPVAFAGHLCACGCALVSSLPDAGVR